MIYSVNVADFNGDGPMLGFSGIHKALVVKKAKFLSVSVDKGSGFWVSYWAADDPIYELPGKKTKKRKDIEKREFHVLAEGDSTPPDFDASGLEYIGSFLDTKTEGWQATEYFVFVTKV